MTTRGRRFFCTIEEAGLCVREYHRRGLIVNNAITKQSAKKCHKTVGALNKIDFHTVVLKLLSSNCLMKINHDTPDILVFKPGKLASILQGQDELLGRARNQVLVPQSISFRTSTQKPPPTNNDQAQNNAHICQTCSKQFQTKEALQQHKNSKNHILTQVTNKPKPWAMDNFNKKKEITVEYEAGKGNMIETISKSTKNFTIYLNIRNFSDHNVQFDEVNVVNRNLKRFVKIHHTMSTLVSGVSYEMRLNVSFPNNRSYMFPMLFMFAYNDQPIGILKKLQFEIIPDLLHDLMPTTPYIKKEPVIKETDQNIIPGEHKSYPTKFVAKYKLKQYELTKDYQHIFNSGLQSENHNKSSEKLRNEIKSILDFENPQNSLNFSSYCALFDLLLFLEEHQMQIDIRNYDTTTKGKDLEPVGKLYKLQVPELSENRPSLIHGDSVYISNIGAKIKYEGIVQQKHIDAVLLGINASFGKIFVPGKAFQVEFGFNRYTLRVEHQAVQLVRSTMSAPILMCPVKPIVVNNITSLNWFERNLNEEQQNAVLNILSERQPKSPYIIFGPPGTGKTTTLVEAILQANKMYPERKILICTPSNDAANVVLRRLIKNGGFSKTDMLRFVSLSCHMDENHEDIKKYCNFTRGEFYYPSLGDMQKYKIVVSTLTNSARLYNMGIPKGHFEYLFIDEAGHATETETLIPISGLMVSASKFLADIVLVGDPKQLGPIIHSSIAIKFGFATSMLERYMNTVDLYARDVECGYDKCALTKLVKNYRSHPSIIEIPRDEFYDKEFVSAASEDIAYMMLGHDVLPNKKFPMIFHNVLGTDTRESNNPSFFNLQEIVVVIDYLSWLIGSLANGRRIDQKDIVVISPYRKQVLKLRRMCEKKNWNSIKVGSVEQLQGQESLIVIITTVRSKPEYTQHDAKFNLGFLKNPKRFNVAVTRAKALLVIIGNGNLLYSDPLWKKYIEKCLENGSVKGPTDFAVVNPDDPAIQELEAGFELIQLNPEDREMFLRGDN